MHFVPNHGKKAGLRVNVVDDEYENNHFQQVQEEESDEESVQDPSEGQRRGALARNAQHVIRQQKVQN